MNTSTKQLLDQIVEDKKLLQKKMIWELDSPAMATLSAFLFASAGKKADVERYAECKKYLKKNIGVFSELRGISSVIVITKMCLSENYEEYLTGVNTVYKKLRAIHKLTASPYMVLAAINIYEAGGVVKADENIEKFETVYKELKSKHFWLTSDADRPFVALMTSRGINVDALSDEVSKCYDASKKMSFSKEAMHTVSQIMSLSPKSIDAKVEDLRATMEAFKKNGVKGLKYQLMPVAAALGLVNENPEAKASKIRENYEYLKGQKGFKWYLSDTKRSLYSSLAYAIENLSRSETVLNSVISTALTNIIIEEIIIFIMISTTSQLASSNSSGGN